MNLYVTANQNNPVPDYENGIKILHSKFYNYANYLSEKNLGWYDGQGIETSEQKNLRSSPNYLHLKYLGLFSSTSHPSRFLAAKNGPRISMDLPTMNRHSGQVWTLPNKSRFCEPRTPLPGTTLVSLTTSRGKSQSEYFSSFLFCEQTLSLLHYVTLHCN